MGPIHKRDCALRHARKGCHGQQGAQHSLTLHLVKDALRLKRPNRQGQIILLHNNARPHVAQVNEAALQKLEWDVLPHPPYSADFAQTDYHLFRSLQNLMRDVTFYNEEILKNSLNSFFDTRPDYFWWNGINKLVKRWEEAIHNNGEYING
ncbi:histone-lysine N-methyltransferase SETMAR [Trichonephila clavipes]|nr:histone-lysine N-methyltransferase SETMAR [Trichonephila clavipes]